MASYYLLDRRNPHGPHYYTSRRGSIQGVVVHITAGLEDLDTRDDQSAEATARYAATTDRPVSWHAGADSDSWLWLLPASYTAFHVRGYNSRFIGLEISKKHVRWASMSEDWVAKTLRNAANALAPWVREHSIPLRRLSRAQVDRGERGFVAHSDLDPARRSDPGPDFPWDRFFALLRGDTSSEAPAPVEDDDMIRPGDSGHHVFQTLVMVRRFVVMSNRLYGPWPGLEAPSGTYDPAWQGIVWDHAKVRAERLIGQAEDDPQWSCHGERPVITPALMGLIGAAMAVLRDRAA